MLFITLIAFAIAWWLGLYLIARGPRKGLLVRAGLGLLAYALVLACEVAGAWLGDELPEIVGRAQAVLTFLPALAWTGATLRLLPEAWQLRARLDRLWLLVLVPLTLLILLVSLTIEASFLHFLLAALVLLPLLGAVALVIRARHEMLRANVVGLLGVTTLFFALGFAPLALSFELLPRLWFVLAIGTDMALLGFVVARFDAFDEGEALRRDMLRSLLAAEGAALLFGGQVALALLLTNGGFPLVALLFSTVAVAIAIVVLSAPVERLLDRLAFPDAPALQQARAELRENAEALPRVDTALPLAGLDEAEFARLTRRALSHYGDLPKLASNPLTQLPRIDERLAERGVADHPLERAAELKALLAESINRLKPRDGDFGTSDAWRHYNALYFPYVVGLRPYSRRIIHDDLDPDARRAFDWFSAQVPERTLHNWQNAAARLVAQDLRQHTPPSTYSTHRPKAVSIEASQR